jgi:hypothetical protein
MNLQADSVLGTVEAALADALHLRDASVVIYRRNVLVELKTQMLNPGLIVSWDGERRAWQVGPFDGHHAHLDLDSVTSVWFHAEPVPCQGGRLNYTVWFLTDRDCDNPYLAQGVFSITLNSPYDAYGRPKAEQIAAVYAIYDCHCRRPGVSASEGFLAARPVLTRGSKLDGHVLSPAPDHQLTASR